MVNGIMRKRVELYGRFEMIYELQTLNIKPFVK